MRPKNLIFAAIAGPTAIAGAVRFTPLRDLLSSNYIPHRYCYLAQPGLIWTNAATDLLIAASYVALFLSLAWALASLRRVPELRQHLWVFASFGAFILACGVTHFMEIVTVWWPVYRLSAAFKVLCALISVPTAIVFTWKAPYLTRSIRGILELIKKEQRQSEDLRKSQEFLDRTGRIAGIGGWELDLITSHVTWSPETYRIHGAPPDFKPDLQEGIRRFAPEARPVLLNAVLIASAGGPGWDLELPLTRFDGQQIWVRTVGEAEFDGDKPVRLLGGFQDVSDQVAAREALRKANERIALATDSGGIGIFDWDIQQDLCTADPCLHRLYGLEPQGSATPLAYWAAPMHPEDRDGVVEALNDAVADLRPYDTEFRVIWQDGSIHHIRASARVTRNEHGTPVNMVGVNWDVTESRCLTAELAKQHDLLRVTLQSIADGVITTDVDRNVLWLNPVAERMTGWSAEEAHGSPLARIFNTLNTSTREPVENPVANVAAQGTGVGIARQTLLVSRDGTEYGIENQAAPIRDGNGELIGNILVFRDVTEQRRLAAETEQITKLQLELRTKDEFLSHVSHELRSPLTSIYSFSSILADDLAGETSPEQKEYLQIILKNVVQLQSMIEDLLTVTQAREGRLSIEVQRAEPIDAVRDALHTLASAASTKRIDLSLVDAIDLPPTCADPVRLRQILIILLDNAVKFTPAGGTVTVSVTETEGDCLLFRVGDTGCGIPEEKRALIFEKLYQVIGPAPPDTSQMGRIGLGLGLHIARDLVTRQRGFIWVSAAPGGGSIFAFTLHVWTDECAAAMNEEANAPRRRKSDQPLDTHPALVSAA